MTEKLTNPPPPPASLKAYQTNNLEPSVSRLNQLKGGQGYLKKEHPLNKRRKKKLTVRFNESICPYLCKKEMQSVWVKVQPADDCNLPAEVWLRVELMMFAHSAQVSQQFADIVRSYTNVRYTDKEKKRKEMI